MLILLVSTQWASGLQLASHYLVTEHLAWTLIGQKGRDLPTGYLTQSVHTSGATLLFLVTAISNIIVKGLTQLIWGASTVSTSNLRHSHTTHYLLAVVILLLTLLHPTGSTGSHLSTTLPRGDRIDYLTAPQQGPSCSSHLTNSPRNPSMSATKPSGSKADNSMPANPLVASSSISLTQLLPCYASVRAIPSKPMGILAMGISFLTLANLGDTGFRSWSSVSSRQASLLFLALTDLIVLCLTCLQVNGGETLYLLLTASAMGLFSATLTTDDTLSLPVSVATDSSHSTRQQMGE